MSDPETDSPALPGLFGVAGLPALPPAPVRRRARKAPGGASASAVRGAPRPVGGEGGAAAPPLGKDKSIVGHRGAGLQARPSVGQRHEPEGPAADAASPRGRRYWLQRQAARMAPELRGLSSCLRRTVPGTSVSVVKGEAGAGYRGLMRCAGVWACPCCAPRIAAGRTTEIETGIANHVARLRAEGCTHEEAAERVPMLTLTLRHGRGDALTTLLDALRGAMRRLRQHRGWRALKGATVGTITSLEVTHGEHGWHPHLHLLLLGKRDVTPWQLERLLGTLRDAWDASLAAEGRDCGRAGFEVTRKVGAAARYVAKLAWEAAGVGTKRARGKGGRTGWQLLEDACEGDCEAIALWREYALATKGRNWITWTPGLKAALGVEEVSDEDLVEAEVGADVIAVLPVEAWRAVVRCELRGQVLDAADADGEEGVWRVVREAEARDARSDRRRRPPPV